MYPINLVNYIQKRTLIPGHLLEEKRRFVFNRKSFLKAQFVDFSLIFSGSVFLSFLFLGKINQYLSPFGTYYPETPSLGISLILGFLLMNLTYYFFLNRNEGKTIGLKRYDISLNSNYKRFTLKQVFLYSCLNLFIPITFFLSKERLLKIYQKIEIDFRYPDWMYDHILNSMPKTYPVLEVKLSNEDSFDIAA